MRSGNHRLIIFGEMRSSSESLNNDSCFQGNTVGNNRRRVVNYEQNAPRLPARVIYSFPNVIYFSSLDGFHFTRASFRRSARQADRLPDYNTGEITAMAAELSAEAFNKLLQKLDPDPDKAAAEYLRLRKTAFYILRRGGLSDGESYVAADKCLDLLAKKLLDGEDIKSIPAYAAGIVRNLLREHYRKNPPEQQVEMNENDGFRSRMQFRPEHLKEEDPRRQCLDECLQKICKTVEDRELLIRYYDAAEDEKNKDNRRKLADEFGLTYTNLTTRMSRLLKRLEKCISNCGAKK